MSDNDAAAAGARPASREDLPEIARLYRLLADEMAALREPWPLIDGIAEPVATTLAAWFADPDWNLIVGLLGEVPVGFVAWRDEAMLPQAGGDRVAAVRFIFTEVAARGVGVGEAMTVAFLAEAGERGITRFDAYVSPGHREAKNFFEANGFKARSIVMHRSGSE